MKCSLCGTAGNQQHSSIIECVQALVVYIHDSERAQVDDLQTLENRLLQQVRDVERTADNAASDVDDLKGRVDRLEDETA